MSIRKAEGKNIIVVELTHDPNNKNEDFEKVSQMVTDEPGSDVVVDLSAVRMLSSIDLQWLFTLRNILKKQCHRLVIYSDHPQMVKLFVVTGLDSKFDFKEDKPNDITNLKPIT